MKHIPIRTALIGDITRYEFGEVVESVRRQSECRLFYDLKSFVYWLDAEVVPPIFDLVFVLQAFSEQYAQSDLDRILEKYPITPIVSVLGSWCEGEQRTATPLVGTRGIYAHNWCPEGENEFKRLIEGDFSTYGLHSTFSAEEIFLKTTRRLSCRQQPMIEQKAWVFTAKKTVGSDSEMDRLLSEILRTVGFSVDFVDRETTAENLDCPDVIFWDLNESPTAIIVEILLEIKQIQPGARVILFKNAPRPEEEQSLFAAGADFVISKPFELTSLLNLVSYKSSHER